MTTAPPGDRSHESILNEALARFLRERGGLDAAAETLHGGKRPDVPLFYVFMGLTGAPTLAIACLLASAAPFVQAAQWFAGDRAASCSAAQT